MRKIKMSDERMTINMDDETREILEEQAEMSEPRTSVAALVHFICKQYTRKINKNKPVKGGK